MFKRRKPKPAEARLCIRGDCGQALYDGSIERMELPEALIIALSVEFFNDPEPCHIHRSAVMKRVFLELEQALSGGAAVAAGDLSPAVARYLAGYPGAASVALTKEAAS